MASTVQLPNIPRTSAFSPLAPLRYLALVCVVLVLVCEPLICHGWQYGPAYSYPCDLTTGEAWGHYSSGLTNSIWQPDHLNNKFSIIPSSDTYRSGHNVTFTIQSTFGMTFKGFMLQSFDSNNNRVGRWSLASPSNVQPSNANLVVSNAFCATNTSNSLTHGISLAVTGFSAIWTPPPLCCTGDIRITVTIMQVYNVYWIYNFHLHEDNSAMPPEPVQQLQIQDSWANTDNSTSATISWMPGLAGGGANTSVTVSAYVMSLYIGNTKLPSKTVLINGSAALPNAVTGYVSVTVNGLLPLTNYTVSVSAQTNVSRPIATQNMGNVVAAGVILTGSATSVTLITPNINGLNNSPLAPTNVTIKYQIVSTNNNIAAQVNSTGVGSGVTAIITYQLNAASLVSLQILGISVIYSAMDSHGIMGNNQTVTYFPPSLPVAVKGIYTISLPFLLPNTQYEFSLQLHTSGLNYVSTDIINAGQTPGCLNSCSGIGYCHPQLLMCHCPKDYLGPDCSIPVQFYNCDFSKPYDSLCITWVLQNYNFTQNTGELYMRVHGDIDGGFFSILFGVWLQDGMHGGSGFNIFVNPLTNETIIGAPKGQPGLLPNHAQKVTANGFVGYYNNNDGTSDLTWWFQVVNPTNLNNQFPFYNLTSGIGQQYNASWCRGPGINGGHDVFHRGKLYISIADNWIQRIGDHPDYVKSFAPFYITTSGFVGLAVLYQMLAGRTPKTSKTKKSQSKAGWKNSMSITMSGLLHKPILPASLSPYFLLPASNLSQNFQNPVLKFLIVWSIRLWDLVTFNIRRAIGEMIALDFIIVTVYFTMVLAFLLNMMHQYNDIQWGLPANTAYGYIILWHLTLMFIPISKHSIILHLFHIPFERAIKYHRWISRMTVVWMAVHFASESDEFYSKIVDSQLTGPFPTFWSYISTTNTTQYGHGNLYGFICGVLALAIFVSSLTVVRRYFFAIFYISHLLMFPAFVVLAVLHHYYVLYFALPPLGVWVLDHIIRWARVIKYSSRALNLKYWRVATSKHVRQTVRLDLSANGMTTKPGQYAFICVPSLSLMWHPFSISTSQNVVQVQKDGGLTVVPNEKLSFHIVGMGGLTFSERLVALSRKLDHHDSDAPSKMPLVLVDGPYGEISLNLENYSNLVIVAGGIGVTAFVGLLNDLLVQHVQGAARKVPLQHVRLIWVTRDSSSFYHWCGDLLNVLYALPAFASVQLFETDTIQDSEYGFDLASTQGFLHDVNSSSQLVPDEVNQQKAVETSQAEKAMKALKISDDVKTPAEMQQLSPPQVIHHPENNSVELTHVMFHISAPGVGDEFSLKRNSLTVNTHENDMNGEGEEMKIAEQDKMETEMKFAAQTLSGAAATAVTAPTQAPMIPPASPQASPPASPRGRPRYPVTRARPNWGAVFTEVDNAIVGGVASRNNTAVLVCGPQGLAASVHEQASKRNWPMHKELFSI